MDLSREEVAAWYHAASFEPDLHLHSPKLSIHRPMSPDIPIMAPVLATIAIWKPYCTAAILEKESEAGLVRVWDPHSLSMG